MPPGTDPVFIGNVPITLRGPHLRCLESNITVVTTATKEFGESTFRGVGSMPAVDGLQFRSGPLIVGSPTSLIVDILPDAPLSNVAYTIAASGDPARVTISGTPPSFTFSRGTALPSAAVFTLTPTAPGPMCVRISISIVMPTPGAVAGFEDQFDGSAS